MNGTLPSPPSETLPGPSLQWSLVVLAILFGIALLTLVWVAEGDPAWVHWLGQ